MGSCHNCEVLRVQWRPVCATRRSCAADIVSLTLCRRGSLHPPRSRLARLRTLPPRSSSIICANAVGSRTLSFDMRRAIWIGLHERPYVFVDAAPPWGYCRPTSYAPPDPLEAWHEPSRCQRENPPHLKFYLESATPLALRCWKCET